MSWIAGGHAAGRRHGRPHPPPAPARGARPKSDIHPVLEEQLLEAADTSGKMRLRKLIEIVSRQYDAYENDRTSLETVMRLASDEATAMTERLERESVGGSRRSSTTSRTASSRSTTSAASRA